MKKVSKAKLKKTAAAAALVVAVGAGTAVVPTEAEAGCGLQTAVPELGSLAWILDLLTGAPAVVQACASW